VCVDAAPRVSCLGLTPQLAGYSLLIYVPMAVSVHANLLHGWSLLTWLTAFLGALGGILIGASARAAKPRALHQSRAALGSGRPDGGAPSSPWALRAVAGLVINYMDSISKNLALSVAIVLTAVLDHVCFDGPMNLPIIAAAAIVIISIASYSAG
jgi:hypothetical protein